MASKLSKKEAKALERLEGHRREVEAGISKLRTSLNREMGSLAPRRAVWAVPLVAFAFGIALALGKKAQAKKAQGKKAS